VIACFVDIGGIAYHHCLNFLFIILLRHEHYTDKYVIVVEKDMHISIRVHCC